jgi:hypothetical protein
VNSKSSDITISPFEAWYAAEAIALPMIASASGRFELK